MSGYLTKKNDCQIEKVILVNYSKQRKNKSTSYNYLNIRCDYPNFDTKIKFTNNYQAVDQSLRNSLVINLGSIGNY